jgi:hypothetical protein
MFLFNDPAEFDELEQIEYRANPPATSVGLPLAATVGLGCIGFALTASPVVGGSLAAMPAYFLYKRLTRAFKNNVFLRRNPGSIAHLIKSDRDMIDWIEAHGKEDVTNQLLLAIRHRQKLTPCARRTARDLIPPAQLPHRKVSDYLAAVSEAEVAGAGAEVAIDGAEGAVASGGCAGPLQAIDIAEALAFNLKPTIITSRPRVGKGIVVSHGITAAKRIHGATVWVLQPKPAVSELGYWKQADRFLGLNLEDYPQDDETVADQLTNFFMEWRSQGPRPTLLIVDELVKIQAMQPKWYKQCLIPQLLVEGSSGETDGRFLWAITQSPLVSDLGMSGGNRSTFDFLALEKAETAEHAESVLASMRGMKELPPQEAYEASPVGTLFYHSQLGRWAAVPRYEVPEIAPGDKLCPELQALVNPKPAYAVVSSGPSMSPATIPETPLPDIFQAFAAATVTTSFLQENLGDPALELIDAITDPDHKEALLIAYQWALAREKSVGQITRADFLNRAKNERRSLYLKTNREGVWRELEGLIP